MTLLVLPVLYTLLQIFSLSALGFLLSRYWGWSHQFFKSLSRFLVKIALPLYFFVKISQTDPADIKSGALFPAASLVVIGLGLLFSGVIVSFLSLSGREKKATVALAGFGNSGIIPLMLIEIFPQTLPQVAARFGTLTPTLYVGAYLLVQSPLLWSLGYFLVRGEGKRPQLKELVTPPLIGILTGFLFLIPVLQRLLLNQALPFFHVHSALNRIGQAAYPLILLCLGSMLADLKPGQGRPRIKAALAVTAVRFLAMPAVFLGSYFLLFRHMQLSAVAIWVLFLECHVPPATNLAVMALSTKNEDLVSFSLLFTYLGYLLVLPVFLLIFLALPAIL